MPARVQLLIAHKIAESLVTMISNCTSGVTQQNVRAARYSCLPFSLLLLALFLHIIILDSQLTGLDPTGIRIALANRQ